RSDSSMRKPELATTSRGDTGSSGPATTPTPPTPAPQRASRAVADSSVASSRLRSRTPASRHAPPLAASSGKSGRLPAELLEDKEFRMVFDDVQRLRVALDFQEMQFGVLRIMVGPGLATVSSAYFNL